MSPGPRTFFIQIPVWLLRHPQVAATPGGTILRVYAALLVDAGFKTRITRLPVKAIMDETGLGRSVVYRALGVLRDVGGLVERADGSFFMPLDDPTESTTVDEPSATVDEPSATVDAVSTTVDGTITPIEGSTDTSSLEPDVANRILRWVWENRHPKPVAHFMGTKAIVRRLLDAGWTEQQVGDALMDATTFTTGAIEFALNERARGGRRTRSQQALTRDDGVRARMLDMLDLGETR